MPTDQTVRDSKLKAATSSLNNYHQVTLPLSASSSAFVNGTIFLLRLVGEINVLNYVTCLENACHIISTISSVSCYYYDRY